MRIASTRRVSFRSNRQQSRSSHWQTRRCRKVEAAAKDESHDGCDKKKSNQKAQWTQTTVAGSVNSWLLIVKKKTWIHQEWEDTVRQWHNLLCEMTKKDEEKKRELEHRMIDSADGGTGLLHKITKTTARRGEYRF